MITATGLGSGIDVGGLVTQLVDAERAGTDLQLNRKELKYNSKLSALGALKGVVSGLQSSLGSLNSLSSFDKKSVNLSDSSSFSVIAKSEAVPSNYEVEVQQLATTHGLASGTYADSDSTAVGTGTLTFRFGTVDYDTDTDTVDAFTLKTDSKVTSLTIDSSNNTLQGIMNAINEEDFGVKASVVNDGTGYRLLFVSEDSGSENAIEISVDDDDLADGDSSGLSALAFNTTASNVNQTKTAQDAIFSLNGLAVTSATNTVTEAIPGVTLTLKAITENPIDFSVAKNTSTVTSAVKSLLTGYNSFAGTVKSLTQYNSETGAAGLLIGDFTVRGIVSQVDSIMRNAVDGLSTEFGSLAEIGITTNKSGNYELDQTRFDEVLQSDPTAIQALFTAFGIPSDPDINFKTSTDDTLVGDYAVNITNLATAGEYTGSGALPADFGVSPLTIDADNDAMSLEVDGVDVGEILITQGVYNNGDDLANEIQARINGASAMTEANKTVAVAYDAGSNAFIITSDTVGNASAVNITAVDTNSAADLGFSVLDGIDGLDVGGTINGVAATGAGQLLTASDESDANGLQVEITGGAIGDRGSINYNRGIASQLDLLLGKLLDEDDGSLSNRISNLKDNLESVNERRAEMETKWEKVRDRYLRKYNAMDALLNSLQSTSSYLQTQLAALPEPNSINRN